MKGIPTTPNQLATFILAVERGKVNMGETIVTIPASEYKRLRDVDTRVRVLLDHMAHHGTSFPEDVYLILGMVEDAEMEKARRDELIDGLLAPATKKKKIEEIEVIA